MANSRKIKVINVGDIRPDDDPDESGPGVQIALSVSKSVMKRLIAMRRAKGMTKEQPLIRLFITEGLDRGGF